MATTCTWGIAQLDVAPVEDELEQVVKTIHWTLSASDENGVSAGCYGSVGLSSPEEANFTDYEQLTQEEVIAWLKTALDANTEGDESQVEQLEESLAKQIEAKKQPSIVQPPLPWQN